MWITAAIWAIRGLAIGGSFLFGSIFFKQVKESTKEIVILGVLAMAFLIVLQSKR